MKIFAKKFLVVPAVMLGLTACGTTTTPSDFASLYNANIKAEIQKAGDFMAASYGEKKEYTGQFNGSLDAGTVGE